MAGRVEFDILAKDHASSTLAAIGRAFRKVSKDADDSGRDAGRGFGGGLKRWFTGDGKGLFTEIGKSGGTVFGSGLLGALKTPILGPAIVGVVGAAAATAMPAVGAIAAGALVTGFGAGLAGLGLVFAAKNETVKAIWSDTLSDLGEQMRLLSEPFESTLIAMAGFAQRTFNAFRPALAKAFQGMAGPVERFADEASRSLEGLIPAIDPIANAFTRVLDSLGPAMTSAIGDVADGMIDLADSVAKNPQALADTVTGIGQLADAGLDLIGTLNDINGAFERLPGGKSGVDLAFGFIEGNIRLIDGAFGGLQLTVDGVNAVLGRNKVDADTAGASMGAAADQVIAAAAAYGALGPKAAGAIGPLGGVADAVGRQKREFSGAIAAMGQWNTAALASSNASIAYQAAIDAASVSVKENGKTLDINTEKGRANRTALNNVAAAANAQTQAMDDAGASNVDVAAKAQTAKANFIKLAMQMNGGNRPAAEKLATALINIPNVSREAKLTANKRDLDTKLADVRRQLRDPNLTKERRAKLTADKARLEAAVRAAKAALASLPSSKTVTLTTRFITERIVREQSGATGGHVPTHASGGIASGWSWVGERGPELAHFSSPTRITPAGESRRMAGGSTNVSLSVSAPGNAAEAFIVEMLRRFVKVNGGGNVQRALGR